MPDQLRLLVEPDTDGTCELFAEVNVGKFAGLASAWFGLDELEKFGLLLSETYPLTTSQRLQLEGGFRSKTGAPVIQDLHVGLHVYPIGSAGIIGLRVQLASAVHDGERMDERSSVRVELKTNYERLRMFGQSVVALAQGSQEPAVLVASDA